MLRSQSLIHTSTGSHFSSFPIWYTKAKSIKSYQQLRAFGLAFMVFLTICTSIHISIPVHRPLDSPRGRDGVTGSDGHPDPGQSGGEQAQTLAEPACAMLPGPQWKTASVTSRASRMSLGRRGTGWVQSRGSISLVRAALGRAVGTFTEKRRDQELLHRGLKGAQETPRNGWLCMRSHQQGK